MHKEIIYWKALADPGTVEHSVLLWFSLISIYWGGLNINRQRTEKSPFLFFMFLCSTRKEKLLDSRECTLPLSEEGLSKGTRVVEICQSAYLKLTFVCSVICNHTTYIIGSKERGQWTAPSHKLNRVSLWLNTVNIDLPPKLRPSHVPKHHSTTGE